MSATCRAMRLLRILMYLKERPRTVEEIADYCEVSPRTIRRDLLDLQSRPVVEALTVERRWCVVEHPG